jgi:prefoldin subunit 5
MAFSKSQGINLAAMIKNWLIMSRQGPPQGELLNFVNDLESANNVGVWAGVNYERILPFKAPVSKLVRGLAILRNSLVFLPIVVTWVALENAAGSWQDDNFLKHWQNMGGLLSLKSVAWFDAAIIFGLIVLTIITGFLEESDKGRLFLEEQYQGLIIALERDLSGYRYLSLSDINNAASDTLNSLHGATQLVQSAAQSFADSSKQAHDAIVGANDVVHRTFGPAVQRLDDTIDGLKAAVGVHQDMAALVTQVQADFATQMAALRQGVIDVLVSVETRTSQIMSNVDGQVHSAATEISTSAKTAMSDMSQAAQVVATGLTQQTTQQLQGVSNNLGQAANSLNQLTAGLDSIIKGLSGTSNNVMVNTAQLADDLATIHNLLQQVAQKLPR